MTGTPEPYDVIVSGEIYQVMREEDDGTVRICIYSSGRLRFSLPDDTPQEEVRKFIQVYTLGVSDGKNARVIPTEDRIREHLKLAAQRLGRAAWSLKAGAK